MTCDLNIDDVTRPIELESDDSLTVGPTGEVSVLQVPGPISSMEVWFDVPFDWLRGCIVRAYGRVGSVRIELGRVDLKNLAPETVGGRGSGLCLTVQGRPASSYEVTVERATGSPTTEGRFFARAWMGMDQSPGVATGTSRASTGRRFGATSTPLTVGGAAVENSMAYLFQAGGRTRVEIDRIVITYSAVSTEGKWSIHGARISGEGASRGGDVEQDVEALDGSGATSNAYLVHSASPDPIWEEPDVFCVVLPFAVHGQFEWTAEASGGPIVLRPGRCEGFDVRWAVETGDVLDNGATVSVAYFWRELEDPPVDLAHYGFIHEWRADEGAPETGDVTTWTDRLSAKVFSASSNKPAIGSDADGRYIDFVAATSEHLVCSNLGLLIPDATPGPAGEYTILLVVKSNTSKPALDAYSGTGDDRLVISRTASTSWTHALQDADGDSDSSAVADTQNVWRTLIFRYKAGVLKARVQGVNGTDSTPPPTLGDITLEGAWLGGPHTAGSSSDYINMQLRHFAIANRALTDDECVAVEGLMTTYWNIR